MHSKTIRFKGAPKDWPFTDSTIGVVAVQDGGEWLAVALEMDLQAHGKTHQAALDALAEMVISQIAFAMQKKQPDLVFRDAEPMYWQMYDRERRAAMRATLMQQKREDSDIRASNLPINDGLIAQFQRKKPFQRQRAAA